MFNLYILLLPFIFSLINGHNIKSEEHIDKCIVEINGTIVEKLVGETWNSTNPCIKYACDYGPKGIARRKQFKEYCFVTCNNEFELKITEGQCCGNCVQTKCKYDEQFYSIGETWKSSDNCTFLECTNTHNKLEISSYKKSCPEIGNCPEQNIYYDDCCQYCKGTNKDTRKQHSENIIEDENDYMNESTYINHPCIRNCFTNSIPMTCKYTFLIEWYETLSKACYDCPYNQTDCSRPHCISGDGVRRSILVVNRMMPGPAIQVCEGDKIVVDVKNHLLGEGTTIHWHGLHQRKNPYMDGVPHISQCAISAGTSFQYEFYADNPGTHFWHSHIGMQRGDGAFGSLIIKSAENHYKFYDYDLPEHVLIVQDWAHVPGVAMFSAHHHSIGSNKPPNILINGKGKYFEKIEETTTIIPSTTTTPTTTTTTTTTKRSTRSSSISSLTTETTTIPFIPTESQTETTVSAIDVDIDEQSTTLTSTINQTKTTTIVPKDEVGLLQDDQDSNMKMHNVEPTEQIDVTTETQIPLDNITQSNPSIIYTNRQKRDYKIFISEESEMIPFHTVYVKQGKKYRFRLINAEFLNCPMEVSIDSHNLTVISSDGYDIKPIEVSSFVNYAGERFDFIVDANQKIDNYWIRVRGLMDCGPQFTAAHQVAILRYKGAPEIDPNGTPIYDFVRDGLQLNSLNKGTGNTDTMSIAEATSVYPDDLNLLKDKPDLKFYVYYDFYGKDNPHFHVSNLYGFKEVPKGKLYTPQLNHISMKMPSLPLMPSKDQLDDSLFCNASSLAAKGINCKKEFCECSHVLQIPLNAVVEMVLIDEGFTFDANHPFHLHGASFRVIAMERLKKEISAEEVKQLDEQGKIPRRLKGAPIKDTVTIPDGGYTIIRFIADNPGYWLFHCHIEFHAEIGMALVLKIGEHKDMKPVPKNFPTCSDYTPNNTPIENNARKIEGSFLILIITVMFYTL